jgi:hypothetical protein
MTSGELFQSLSFFIEIFLSFTFGWYQPKFNVRFITFDEKGSNLTTRYFKGLN